MFCERCTLAPSSGEARVKGASPGADQSFHKRDPTACKLALRGEPKRQLPSNIGDGHDVSVGGEKFDIVISTGVVYHLLNSMDFLTRIARVTRELMVVASEMLIDSALSDSPWFIEGKYLRDDNNWWIYGLDCLAVMARAAGFRPATFPGVLKPRFDEAFCCHSVFQ
jgi:Methyltransferase domain